MHEKRQGRAWWHWFAADDSAVEKKLILKLDLLIVTYAFIVYCELLNSPNTPAHH